jgi:hypothetical protein
MSLEFQTMENAELRKLLNDVVGKSLEIMAEVVDIARQNNDSRIQDLANQSFEFAEQLKKYNPDFDLPDRSGESNHSK